MITSQDIRYQMDNGYYLVDNWPVNLILNKQSFTYFNDVILNANVWKNFSNYNFF